MEITRALSSDARTTVSTTLSAGAADVFRLRLRLLPQHNSLLVPPVKRLRRSGRIAARKHVRRLGR
jgi:hypothetical protein